MPRLVLAAQGLVLAAQGLGLRTGLQVAAKPGKPVYGVELAEHVSCCIVGLGGLVGVQKYPEMDGSQIPDNCTA